MYWIRTVVTWLSYGLCTFLALRQALHMFQLNGYQDLSYGNYLASHKLTKGEKEKYLKQYEKELFETFEKPLRNLTFTQGRIPLRLIDRELGLTSFYIIRDYRGKAAAGFWQGIAKIFGADLKTPYDRFGQDKDLEELVQMYHKGEFGYLYVSIFGKHPPRPAVSPKNDFRQLHID